MSSPSFKQPQLVVTKASELPLSGQALLELMRAVLSRGLPFRFCARGWSMAPFIRDGDVITIAPMRNTLPKPGEVVAFICPGTGKLVVHRVIGKQGGAVLIQGDGLATQPDGVVPTANLLGQVVRIHRRGKAVWLGLGPERTLIAWFSRVRQHIPLPLRLVACRRRDT